jgi:hypothetical protein
MDGAFQMNMEFGFGQRFYNFIQFHNDSADTIELMFPI